ncbi:hypothetical protein C8R45DRAFT_1095057 [Mycena sanguinolenta]|nr:hypothetical protein C8R45DRAFT_1095057 [Mycena sanguinolenta]
MALGRRGRDHSSHARSAYIVFRRSLVVRQRERVQSQERVRQRDFLTSSQDPAAPFVRGKLGARGTRNAVRNRTWEQSAAHTTFYLVEVLAASFVRSWRANPKPPDPHMTESRATRQTDRAPTPHDRAPRASCAARERELANQHHLKPRRVVRWWKDSGARTKAGARLFRLVSKSAALFVRGRGRGTQDTVQSRNWGHEVEGEVGGKKSKSESGVATVCSNLLGKIFLHKICGNFLWACSARICADTSCAESLQGVSVATACGDLRRICDVSSRLQDCLSARAT